MSHSNATERLDRFEFAANRLYTLMVVVGPIYDKTKRYHNQGHPEDPI